MRESKKENEEPLYPLKHPDQTATERWIRYSHSIQTGVAKYLTFNVGQIFTDFHDLSNQCANSIVNKKGLHPSRETAGRWISQLCAPNESFELIESAAGIVIARRAPSGNQ